MAEKLYKRPRESVYVPEFKEERGRAEQRPSTSGRRLEAVLRGLKSVKVGKK